MARPHSLENAGQLAGLRVVEFSAFIAVALGGMTLAQLGAEVIRIDPPGGNVNYRRLPREPSGDSLYWAGLNKGKKRWCWRPTPRRARLTNLPARGWMHPVVEAGPRSFRIVILQQLQGTCFGRVLHRRWPVQRCSGSRAGLAPSVRRMAASENGRQSN